MATTVMSQYKHYDITIGETHSSEYFSYSNAKRFKLDQK